MRHPLRPTTAALAVLGALVFASGCVLDPAAILGGDDYRYPDNRRDRAYDRRVERDVETYVRFMDRELRLDRRQERAVYRVLADRTERALYSRRFYPYPRFGGPQTRAKRNWWRSTDNALRRHLTRRQWDRYRNEVRYRSGDRRYDRRDRYGRPRYDDDDDDDRRRRYDNDDDR